MHLTDNPPCSRARARWRRCPALAACAAVILPATAATRADLSESNVLVVYDSRVPDSLAIAEYYAGSQKVPGGTGSRPGSRPGVRVVNLASLPGAGIPPSDPVPNIPYSDFVSKIRDPLKNYLNTSGLTREVRCLVLTKGLPHRIQDTDHPNPNVGDQPGAMVTEFSQGNLTCASVDSELTCLQQDLLAMAIVGGGIGDNAAEGCIANAYFKRTHTITGYSTASITVPKAFRPWGGTSNRGVFTWTLGAASNANLPGDMYLVCRLDGNTVTDVFGAIDRARNFKVNLDTAVLVLDESGSNATQNVSDTDNELDNDGPSLTNNGDDYEQARDVLLADGRFLPANLKYNQWATAEQFLVGPRLSFGGGVVVPGPVLLLATYGNNHTGFPGVPGDAGTQYPLSFNYAPGAVFNTIESYNGRKFGGIGVGPTPQGQLADFIGAGGTFGIGHVWEPLSLSIPDNDLIVRNFLLGTLTWAEAAWTSIPVVSWMHVVIGDPLARPFRVKEDVNGDERIDQEDLYASFAAASRPRDLNRNGMFDRADVELLRNSVRGSENGNMRPPMR